MQVENREVVVDDAVGHQVVDEIDAALEQARLCRPGAVQTVFERGESRVWWTVTR